MNRLKSSSVTTTGSIITPFSDPPDVVEGDDVVRIGHRQREPVVAEGDRHDVVLGDERLRQQRQHPRIDLDPRQVDELDAGVLVGAIEPLGERAGDRQREGGQRAHHCFEQRPVEHGAGRSPRSRRRTPCAAFRSAAPSRRTSDPAPSSASRNSMPLSGSLRRTATRPDRTTNAASAALPSRTMTAAGHEFAARHAALELGAVGGRETGEEGESTEKRHHEAVSLTYGRGWHGSCSTGTMWKLIQSIRHPFQRPVRRRPVAKRPWFWALVSLIGLVIVFGAMFTVVVPLSSDTLRHRIVAYLSDKLDSDVRTWRPAHARVSACCASKGRTCGSAAAGMGDYPPLISIKSFHVEASLHRALPQARGPRAARRPRHQHPAEPGPRQAEAGSQKAEGKEGRTDDRAAGTSGVEQRAKRSVGDPLKDDGFVIDRMDTNDARLIILPFERDKNAEGVGDSQPAHARSGRDCTPWPFKATLTNAVPPGEIDVNGTFGPWDREEPGDTPLEGAFMFAKADLGVFKGISGTLSSHGYFGGTLAKIDANGETYTPDFTIAVGGHPFPLYVKYQALIDGTNGDTRSNGIDAWFLSSYLHAKGAVLDAPKGEHGTRR